MMMRREFMAMAAMGAAAPTPGPVRRISAWGAEAAGARVKASGKEARVLKVRGPRDELLLLVVLDVTGDLTLVDAARGAAAAEMEKLPGTVYAGLMRSQDGLRVMLDPTVDRAAFSGALNGAQVSGRAGLLETVEPASRLATSILRKTGVRVAVLYLTDSNIYNYREDYTNPVVNMSDSRDLSRRFPDALIREKTAKLAATLGETDAPVFVLHLAFLRDRLNEAYQTGLQQMAEATGGEAVFCRNVGEIQPAVEQVFKKVQAMWAIDVQMPAGVQKNVTVEVSGVGGELQYRSRLALGGGKKE